MAGRARVAEAARGLHQWYGSLATWGAAVEIAALKLFVEDMPGGAGCGGDGAVNCAAVSFGVDGFAGEVESVLDGISEMLLRRESSHFRVAVGSAGEGVGGPVVGVPRFEFVGQDGGVDCEDAGEGREGSREPCGGVGGRRARRAVRRSSP